MLALPLLAATLSASPLNLTLLGQAPSPFYTNDLFVHDNLAFFVNNQNNAGSVALLIWDVDDPANPRLVSTTKLYDGNSIADMHTIYYSNGRVYIGSANQGTIPGFFIYDVTDPLNPRQLSNTPITSGVHNLRLAGNYLYVLPNSGAEVDVTAFDVSDPTRPLQVSQFDVSPGTSYCHDLSIMQGVGYLSAWDDGLFLLDLSDPKVTPLPMLNRHPPAGTPPAWRKNTHSAWPLVDRNYVITCHEANNIGSNTFDVRPGPIGTPLTNYQSHETNRNTTVHDVMVVGHYAYIVYYDDGVRILDVSDPTNLVEVASYLTPRSSFAVWVEDGRVYALDAYTGLFILDFTLPHDAPITLKGVKTRNHLDADWSWNYTGESQYTVRKSLRKDSVAGAALHDVDGDIRWTEPTVFADPRLYYYKINGPWR